MKSELGDTFTVDNVKEVFEKMKPHLGNVARLGPVVMPDQLKHFVQMKEATPETVYNDVNGTGPGTLFALLPIQSATTATSVGSGMSKSE